MTASKLPVGLPRQNPTRSYWQTPPLPIADHRSTPNLPHSSKYVIVGSGITGASIAWKILEEEPDASMVLLEARQACSGATGRNGGHCRAGRYTEFKEDLLDFGKEEALRLEKLEEENVQNVGKLIKDYGIQCDFRDVETLDIYTDPFQWEETLSALQERKRVFEGRLEAKVLTKHRIWSAEETKEKLLIPDGVGAVSFPAYALSPYKFVCALLEMCIKRGLNLQTNTPVVEVEPYRIRNSKKPSWIVHSKRGHIVADTVILATNAYTSALYPPLSEFIIPTRAQVTAIRPGSNIAGNPILKRTCGLNNAVSGDYMQSRSEGLSGAGDVIIGGGRRLGDNGEHVLDDTTIHPRISKYLTHEAAPGFFGKENWGEDGEVLQEWTGIMGYTQDKMPIVGEAPGQRGLWVCAGFNGHGMALTFQSAEALVQLLRGREKEVNTWFPDCYKLSRVLGRKQRHSSQ